MKYTLIISTVLSSFLINCAPFNYINEMATPKMKVIISPYTSKTYLLLNTNSSTDFNSAAQICSSHSNAQLATLSTSSGDVDFLGQFVESLDSPFWIGSETFPFYGSVCAALYSGGAIAIPKPQDGSKSPCDSHLNVICEMKMK